MGPPSTRSFVALVALLGALMLGVTACGDPAPAADHPRATQPRMTIPPGREQAARDLIAPHAERSANAELHMRGPSIDVYVIKWWLMRGDQPRALLVLAPLADAAPDDLQSESFAIQVAWAPEIDQPDPAEQALLDAVIAAVQRQDRGDFHGGAYDRLLRRGESEAGPFAPPAEDPAQVRRLWALRVAAAALLVALGVVAVLRPVREPR